MALTKATEAVVEFARATLVLYAGSPDADFVGLQVSGLVYEMCVGMWRRVIANADCAPGPLGVDAQSYADTCAVLAARKVRTIAALAEQEPSSPASQPAPEQTCKPANDASATAPAGVEQAVEDPFASGLDPATWSKAMWDGAFDRFQAIISETKKAVRDDIDRVAGYRSPTNRKKLGTKEQTPDAVAAYAGVLKLTPDAFLRKNKTLLSRLTAIDLD